MSICCRRFLRRATAPEAPPLRGFFFWGFADVPQGLYRCHPLGKAHFAINVTSAAALMCDHLWMI
jgi:hypothetical protein